MRSGSGAGGDQLAAVERENMELLDILDENMNLIGQAEREKVHAEGLIHQVVHVWIVSEIGGDPAFVFQQRAFDKKDFPEELRDIAGSVFPNSTSKNEIIAMLASEIIDILKEMTRKEIAEEYKSRLFILGMNVTYKRDNIEYSGIAEDINEYGNLIVNTGSEKVVLSSGEITLGSSAFSK